MKRPYSDHRTRINGSVVRQSFRGSHEFRNVCALRARCRDIVPHMALCHSRYFLSRRMSSVQLRRLEPSDVARLWFNVTRTLHAVKGGDYTQGVYGPVSFDDLNSDMTFWVQALCTVEALVSLLPEPSSELRASLSRFSEQVEILQDWEPANGYNWLHGDLHIGNLVQGPEGLRIIDFEYMRFGPRELDFAALERSLLARLPKAARLPFVSEFGIVAKRSGLEARLLSASRTALQALTLARRELAQGSRAN